ncbi:MAG: EcsC family protein [Myxococcaceae bacterium]
MKLLEPFTRGAEWLRRLSPSGLKRLADERLSDIVEREVPRSRARVTELERRYPTAPRRELAQRLIDEKKSTAGMLGGVTGIFGVLAVPPDLLLMAYLELTLLVDVATVYKVNLKAARSRDELLDLFSESQGVGPLTRSVPRALGTFVGLVLARGGLTTVGRTVPLVAAPIAAWLNNKHVQRIGDAAVRHYEGFRKAHRKARET